MNTGFPPHVRFSFEDEVNGFIGSAFPAPVVPQHQQERASSRTRVSSGVAQSSVLHQTGRDAEVKNTQTRPSA